MSTYADIWDDIVEVIGGDDEVLDTFPTEGRTLEQVDDELQRRYGALAPTAMTDWRGAQP